MQSGRYVRLLSYEPFADGLSCFGCCWRLQLLWRRFFVICLEIIVTVIVRLIGDLMTMFSQRLGDNLGEWCFPVHG